MTTRNNGNWQWRPRAAKLTSRAYAALASNHNFPRGKRDGNPWGQALSLLRTNDQLQIRFARLFREHGLTPSQYNILRILRGEARPLPILEIAGRTVTVVPGITGLIDRLEAKQDINK